MYLWGCQGGGGHAFLAGEVSGSGGAHYDAAFPSAGGVPPAGARGVAGRHCLAFALIKVSFQDYILGVGP